MPEFKRVCSPAKRPLAKLERICLLKYVYKDLERCDKRKNSSETLNNALLLIELIKDIVPMLNCDKATKCFVPSLLVMVLSSWSLAGEPLVQRSRSATISDLRQACMTINMPAAKQFLEHTDFREWKNSTGEFSINARMLHADTKNVSLEESASKRVITLSVDKLSLRDVEIVKKCRAMFERLAKVADENGIIARRYKQTLSKAGAIALLEHSDDQWRTLLSEAGLPNSAVSAFQVYRAASGRMKGELLSLPEVALVACGISQPMTNRLLYALTPQRWVPDYESSLIGWSETHILLRDAMVQLHWVEMANLNESSKQQLRVIRSIVEKLENDNAFLGSMDSILQTAKAMRAVAEFKDTRTENLAVIARNKVDLSSLKEELKSLKESNKYWRFLPLIEQTNYSRYPAIEVLFEDVLFNLVLRHHITDGEVDGQKVMMEFLRLFEDICKKSPIIRSRFIELNVELRSKLVKKEFNFNFYKVNSDPIMKHFCAKYRVYGELADRFDEIGKQLLFRKIEDDQIQRISASTWASIISELDGHAESPISAKEVFILYSYATKKGNVMHIPYFDAEDFSKGILTRYDMLSSVGKHLGFLE